MAKDAKVIELVKKNTRGVRFFCVKLLMPKLLEDWQIDFGRDKVEFERPMISFLKEQFKNRPLVGCEIGVREGINALRILKTLNIKKLYLVDPYLPYYEPLFPITTSTGYQNEIREKAKLLLKAYSDKIVWVNETSNNAVSFISDTLDFCYIDGDHSHGQVKLDIENYNCLIKKGGVLGGHDFSTEYFGLCKAVLDASQNPIWEELNGSTIDWWFIRK